jgi:transposase InsO family protein
MRERIGTIFKTHRRRYGYRRIHSELSDQGITCAPARIRRLMQERELKAIQPRTFVPQTSDGRADRPSPNLILDQPRPASACPAQPGLPRASSSRAWALNSAV